MRQHRAPALDGGHSVGRRQPLVGARRLLRRAAALALTGALFLVVLEVLLHLAPGLLGPEARNAMLTRGVAFPGGLFYRVDELGGMLFQRAGFSARTYWDGYRWHHRSDRLGFRNPPDTPTGVLLLGDSMIYGHGVEEEETVAHRLRAVGGWPAYSMARQGDTLFQSYVLFRLYVDELQPEAVILFPFLNDVWELGLYRSDEALRHPPEIDAIDYADLRRRLPEIEARSSSRTLGVLSRSRALRLVHYQARQLLVSTWLPRAWAAEGAAGAEIPPYVAAVDDPTRLALALGYHRRILTDLKRRCDERGVTLHVVYLHVPWVIPVGRAGQERFDRAVADLAAELGIPYATTRGVFDDCSACVLANDGHLSPVGHRLLARFLLESPAIDAGGDPVAGRKAR